MREILFKAKRIDNGEWVEGQYCYMLNPKSENGEPKKHFICNGTNVFNTEIDPETLCQYTGVTDKNGVKIFECDIIAYEYKVGSKDIRHEYEVAWENGGFQIFNCDNGFVGNEVSVIGNIHDKEK